MQILPTEQRPTEIAAEWLAVGVHESDEADAGLLEVGEFGRFAARLRDSKDLPAGLGETTPLFAPPGSKRSRDPRP